MQYRYFVDFWHGFSVFANFSYGIAVLGTPQRPPPYKVQTMENCGLFVNYPLACDQVSQ